MNTAIVETPSDAPENFRPPAAPWSPLWPNNPATGYLSIYLADDMSRLPVRHITRPHDNKSDPNIETGTYGLFSTCEQQMRSGIVNRGAEYIIFMCRWGGRRVLAGYYRLAWKAPGSFHVRQKDFALAADSIHFVDSPIPIADLPEPLKSVVGTDFRLSKRVDEGQTDMLISLLSDRRNAVSDYLEEVHRLERFQAFHTGYRYVSWRQREPFTWELASKYLQPSTSAIVAPNQSDMGSWRCTNVGCGQVIYNQSLLKRCPHCEAMGSLQPIAVKSNITTEV